MRRPHSGKHSRLGSLRKHWHLWRGHHVLATTTRDYAEREGRFQFYFRRAWVCPSCKVTWPA